MVTILAFIVLGGGTALASYVVSSNGQVGPNTIAGHKPPSGDHANLIPASVNGQDVADNSLRGADINESTIGKVPNADALDGIDSTGFVQGNARIITIDTSALANDSAVLFNLPGFARVLASCGDTATAGNATIATYNQSVDVLTDNGGANDDHRSVPANSATGSTIWNLAPAGDSLTLSLGAAGGKVATAFIFEYTFHSNILHSDICKYQGHVIVAGS
jgi:hypothetical protein